MHAQRLNLSYDIPQRKTKVNMSVFETPYKWTTWYGFWHNIKCFFDGIRAMWQRAKKGYCYGDVWDCGDSIVFYMISTLTHYRNKCTGWPDYAFPSFEDWLVYIDEILDLLEFSISDRDEQNEYFNEYDALIVLKAFDEFNEEEKKLRESYYERDTELYQKQAEARKKAFALLSEHIDSIWW